MTNKRTFNYTEFMRLLKIIYDSAFDMSQIETAWVYIEDK